MSGRFATSMLNGQMKDMSNHPLGLYSLSALSAVVVLNKEGWVAGLVSVVLLISIVLLAIQQPPAPDAPEGKMDSVAPTLAKSPPWRSRLNTDAGPFVPRYTARNMRNCAIIQQNGGVRKSPALPPWRTPPGLPAGDALRSYPWKMKIDDSKSDGVEVEITKTLWQRIQAETPEPDETMPETELAVVKVLRGIRQTQEERKANGKKVVNGHRECAKAVKRGLAKCVIVANDLPKRFEELDPTLVTLLVEARANKVPVFKACSRASLGYNGCLGVTTSVLVVLSIEGVEDLFEELLQKVDQLHSVKQGMLSEDVAWEKLMGAGVSPPPQDKEPAAENAAFAFWGRPREQGRPIEEGAPAPPPLPTRPAPAVSVSPPLPKRAPPMLPSIQ